MRNIIITGGELFNKGAQAMIFIAVDQLKKRFPKHKIYVLSEMDNRRSKEEKEKYTFDIIGWHHIKFAQCQDNSILRAVCLLRHRKELLEVEKIYKNTDFMIDVSGYVLGSNWGNNHLKLFAEMLEYAKYFEIPVYLLPQSFGPFDFKGEFGSEFHAKMKELLPLVKKIYARENEGYQLMVDTYNLSNIVEAKDLVLCNKDLDVNNIFKAKPLFNIPEIKDNSVCLIPNAKNSEIGTEEEIFELYDNVIRILVDSGKNVYLISHSELDKKLCKKIKNLFPENEKLCLLEQEFNCLEFNEIVKRFDYVIASRYHSIVHAYKNQIPCIILGWAEKYSALAKCFHQERYLFDVRNKIDVQEMVDKIEYLQLNREQEIKTIGKLLAIVQQENVFDELSLK